MKIAVVATLVASAAAFAPAAQKSSSTALSADFSQELGVQAPLGKFDPLGVLRDDLSEERFAELRSQEIKHGRVAMLAVVGYLVTYAGIRFPGAEDIPAGFAALDAVPGMVWAQFFATTALMEACNRDVTGDSAFPGDFRNGALDFGWDKLDEKAQLRKRAIELNNGRAAQMGILGLMVHEKMGNVDLLIPDI